MHWRTVTPRFFSALDIAMLTGREFRESDGADAPGVCIVNRTLARAAFQTDNPVGRKLRIDRWLEVVGVAADVRQQGADQEPGPEVYVPWAQEWMGDFTIAMRYRGTEADGAAVLRAAVRRADAAEPLGEIVSMDALIARSESGRRFPLVLFSIFSALALGIAVVGIYGVVSQSVAARTQEMGIRLALGAGRASVVALVLRQALAPVALGLVAGLGVALAATRYLETLLYGVRPNDPAVLAAACVIIMAAAVAAALGPSLRAGQADPVEALRGT